jgi:hypothetical protein
MASTTFEISKLPLEIVVKIFSYLDQTDRHFGVARVCKFWLELVRSHLTDKVVVCHELIPHHLEYSRAMYRSPKFTKSSCDWKIVAEKSWFVKKLKLIRVSGADLNDILTATKEFCHNIEEIQIDLLCTKSQLAQDLDTASVLPDWIIPNGQRPYAMLKAPVPSITVVKQH